MEMTKRQAEALARGIRQEEPRSEVEAVQYGRGLWTVLVTDLRRETVQEYSSARHWGERTPARQWQLGQAPAFRGYPTGMRPIVTKKFAGTPVVQQRH